MLRSFLIGLIALPLISIAVAMHVLCGLCAPLCVCLRRLLSALPCLPLFCLYVPVFPCLVSCSLLMDVVLLCLSASLSLGMTRLFVWLLGWLVGSCLFFIVFCFLLLFPLFAVLVVLLFAWLVYVFVWLFLFFLGVLYPDMLA